MCEDGTGFEDGTLYNLLIKDSSVPELPQPTERHPYTSVIASAVEKVKEKGMTQEVVAKKADPLPTSDAETLRLKLLERVLDQLEGR